MEHKEKLSSEEIKSRAEQMGLKKEGNNFVWHVEGKPENEVHAQLVELERRGFKRIEKSDEKSETIQFSYDEALTPPRG